MRKKRSKLVWKQNRFKNVSELIKSFEEYSGFSIDPEEIDTRDKLLDKISEIQDYLSNEVSDICSQYYYEAGQLMPEDED